jgi:hypothetical protein
LLWAGILAGPVAFASDLLVRYALVKWSCTAQQTVVLKVSTAVALVVIAGGGALAWRALMHTPFDVPDDGGRPLERGKFMALFGLILSGFFAIVVVASGFPQWMLDACR